MDGEADIVIIKEETLENIAIRQRINQAKITFYVAVAFVGAWGLIAMFALVHSIMLGIEAPSWAIGVESSTVTAALALIFKDHIPGKSKRKK